jgi:hypothetical protein
MKKYKSILAVLIFLLLSDIVQGGTLIIPTTALQGTDVASGPSFTVSGNFGANDVVSVRGVGVVDVATGEFTVNVAGVIVAPQTTLTGNHPGEVSNVNAIRPDVPTGAVLIGKYSLGFSPLFLDDTTTGLGSPTPSIDISVINRSLGDIFGSGFGGIGSGTVLQPRVNDSATIPGDILDNSGTFPMSTIPVPTSLVLLRTWAVGLVGCVALRWCMGLRSIIGRSDK